MDVEVTFLASHLIVYGTSFETVSLDEPYTVEHLMQRICEQHKNNALMDENATALINNRYVDRDYVIKPGDKVAFGLVVTGG